MREIEVGSGASNNQGGRLFQGLRFTSEELARQPALRIASLFELKVGRLASDVVAHVLSIVTQANFGDPVVAKAADVFDSNDLATLKLACKLWPEEGRGLLLDSEYDVALLRDSAFKSVMESGSDSAIRQGKLFPRVMGFNYLENPNIPDNSEGLKGFAVFPSAILVAFAPVPPSQEVRNAGTRYRAFVDPESGVVLEFRGFGNPNARPSRAVC